MRATTASTPTSILDALRAHVETQGDRVAITFLESDAERPSVTYRELDERARGVACALLRLAEPGERAMLMYPAGLDFIVAFLGCLYAGIVAVPGYPPKKNRKAERILAMARDCEPRLLLCSAETRRSIEREFAAAVPEASVIATDALTAARAVSLPTVSSDQLAFLQYTSGSTAAPRGVMVTHGNMVANEQLIQKHFEFTQDSVMVSWLPMFHDMGLIGGILAPMVGGFPTILMAPETFLREPFRWLQAVTEYRATCTGAPNFAYDLCVQRITEEQKRQLDLSSLTIAYNGAEPVRAATLSRFVKAFASCGLHEHVCFPCYGMAETTLLVSGGPPLTPTKVLPVAPDALEQHRIVEHPDGQPLVSCGQTGSDLEVRVVHPDGGVECQPDEIGELWITGPSVAQGYWNRPDDTARTFQARLAGDECLWFRTGDYGFLRDGELFVTGRLKDLIIIRGRNLYPQDVELLVEQHLPFLPPNSCAAFSVETSGEERLIVVAEGTREMVRWSKSGADASSPDAVLNEQLNALRQAVAEEFEVALTELAFVRPTTFPRTSSGKLQRQLAKSMYLNNDNIVYRAFATPRSESNGQKAISEKQPPLPDDHDASTRRADAAIGWLRDFCQRRLNLLVADERRTFPPHVILGLGSQGLLGLQAPEGAGGLNLTNIDVMRIMEQLAAVDLSLASLVGIHNGLGLRPILNFAGQELKADVLANLASGRMLASFALTEPGAGSNPLAMQSTAAPSGNGWILTAHKQWIGLAQWSGTTNVFARRLDERGRAHGVLAITVPEDHPQLRHGAESLTMGVRAIIQNDVFVEGGYFDAKYVLGKPGEGFTVAQDAMMFCRLGIAAQSIGVMKRCFQFMHRYASRRAIATGRLLDNPVTIDRLQDILLAAEALESLVYGIADRLDRGFAIPVEAYAACKILGPELAWSAADRLMQCLGGRGYIETNVAPRILRDTRLLRIFEGPTEALQMYLGSRVVQQFDTVRGLINMPEGSRQIAERLQQDIHELVGLAGASTAKRQWLFHHAGNLASWAILAAFSSESRRESNFAGSDIRKWANERYERAMAVAWRLLPSRPSVAVTVPLLDHAANSVTESLGHFEDELAPPATALDPLLAREPNR